LKLNREDLTKNRVMKGGECDRETFMKKAKKAGLAAGLLGAIAASGIACDPNITINNIPYVPTNPDAGQQCLTSCEPSEGVLREEGNTAGSNEMSVGNAVLRFKGLVDDGPTKAAQLQLEGCDDSAEDAIKPHEMTTLTINGESADVEVEAMDYDGAGLRVQVIVIPVCEEADAGGAGGAGGSGGDGGAGGDSG